MQYSFIIAIDGPAATGKSTIVKLLSEKLNAKYINTGEIYRVLTLKIIKEYDIKKIKLFNENFYSSIIKNINFKFLLHNNKIISFIDEKYNSLNDDIFLQDVSENVSIVSKNKYIRNYFLLKQRNLKNQFNKIIAEGRDIGTVIFPNANYKFFIDASLNARIQRRLKQIQGYNNKENIISIKREIINRDNIDSNREIAPLAVAKDAIFIDNTNLNIIETFNFIIKYIDK